MKKADILRNELDIDYSVNPIVKMGVYLDIFKYIPQGVRNTAARLLKSNKKQKRDFPIDRKVDDIIKNKNPWPAKFAACFTHDIDSKFAMEKGMEKVLALEEKYGIKSTCFFVPDSCEYKLNKNKLPKKHEVAVHGLSHDGKFHLISKEKRLRRLQKARKLLPAKGFRAPWLARTKDLGRLLEKAGYAYDSSYPDTDPYTVGYEGAGCSTVFPFFLLGTKVVELPVTIPQDWMALQAMKLTPKKMLSLWKKKVDYIEKRGGLALFLTHPHPTTILTKEGMKAYEEIIKYVKSKKPFIGTCEEIAERWRQEQDH